MADRRAWKSMKLLGLTFLVTFLLWEYLYPINVFVVVLHEWSHGLAAILTGGEIKQIYLDHRAGGWCAHTSQWSFVVSFAGYFGSSVLGALLLITGAMTKKDRQVVAGLGLFMAYLALAYVRNGFGLAFCLGFAAFLLFAAAKLSDGLNDFLLRFLGMSSCLYALVRVRGHLLSHWYGWRSKTGDPKLDQIWANSDADVLAQLTGLPATFWWVVFLVLGIGCFALAVKISIEEEAGW